MSLTQACCKKCGKEVSEYGITESEFGCGRCFGEEFAFDNISSAGVYQGHLREMILKFKLSDRTELLEPLSELFAMAFAQADFSEQIDYVAAVPMHWRKRFGRGYNPPQLIAKKICRSKSNIKLCNDIVRVRNTENQAGLTVAGRKRNVKGAFALRCGSDFSGKNVCLIDDVKTTGATLNECAKAFRQAGAEKVFAMVLAVAGQKGR